MLSINETSTVTMAFEGKLDSGDIFAVADEKEPIVITIGNSDIPPTLEQALLGMSAGQSKIVRLPPEEGYGPRQKILLQPISRKSLPDLLSPKPGMILSLKIDKEGATHKVPATIIEVSDETVVVDYNHPLAGHHLTYHVKILKVTDGE